MTFARGKRSMRAAVVAGPERVKVEQVALPEPGAGEVRIRIEGCGVCASNIPSWEGRSWFQYPLEPGAGGHEGWGTIEMLGPGVEHLALGDRVAMLSYHAYAEYDLAPAGHCIRLPESLSAMPFPGEALGCAMNIFRRSEIAAGQTVAIVGVGFLGALLVQLAAEAGARVIAISRRRRALEIATAQGAHKTIPMEDHASIVEQVLELTQGRGCDRVIEAVGKQWPLDLASELSAVRGRLVIAGYHQDGARQVNLQLWNWRGLDVVNAHEREPEAYLHGMRASIAAVDAGELDPYSLFTHRFPLDRLGDALAVVRDRKDDVLKALVIP